MMLTSGSLAAAAAAAAARSSSTRALAQRTVQQQQQHAALSGGASSTARHGAVRRRSVAMRAGGSKLSDKKCEPCEASHDALDNMGLAMVMDEETAQRYRAQVDARWQLVRDAESRLRIRRRLRTKNFTKALALFQLVGGVAEAEGHHPDLHLEGWNNVSIELWTHERSGLSENDFILAAKLDELLCGAAAAELLSKRQPEL